MKDPVSISNKLNIGQSQTEDDYNEEEIKMPWNDKPPSGEEDLECQDESYVDKKDLPLPQKAVSLAVPNK